MAGELFEIKMIVLLFLQGLRMIEYFWLTSNMKAAGSFDDVVFVSKTQDGDKKAVCLQLKHRKPKVGENVVSATGERDDGYPTEQECNKKQNSQTKCIRKQSLTGIKGDFSLIKYLNSYFKVKENHNSDKDLKFVGPFNGMQFVIFTNTSVDKTLLSDLTEVKGDDLFTTGGKSYKVNPESKISHGLKEFFEFKIFLEHLQLDVDQLRSSQKEDLIKKRANTIKTWINDEINLKSKELDATPTVAKLEELLKWEAIQLGSDKNICDEFINNLLICTDQANEKQLEALIKTELIKTEFLTENELERAYDDIIINFTKWWKESSEVLNAKSKTWTDILHSQMTALSQTRMEKLKGFDIDFLTKSTETMLKKMDNSSLLIIFPKKDQTTLTTIKLLKILKPPSLGLDGSIFVTLDVLLKQSNKILSAWKSRWYSTLVVECEVDETAVPTELSKELNDISERLSKRIVLIAKKGHSLTTSIKRIASSYNEVDDDTCWSDLHEESQNFLRLRKVNFQGVTISLGDLMGDNRLLASKLDEGEMNLLLNDALQLGKVLNKSDSWYVPRKLGSGDDFVLLSGVTDKVVLIAGEPGIGKTSLMNELATSTKKIDPSLWVANINMTDCKDYLENVKLKVESQEMAFEFIRLFSKNTGTAFEKEFFHNCWSIAKMVVILDAIDEVSPFYEDQVLSILEKLRKTKLHALWATSRLGMQEKIEKKLKVAAKSISYFSKKDQGELFKAFWKSKHQNTDDGSLEEASSKFGQLTSKIFTDDALFEGIPQLTVMLAEIFESDLLSCTLQSQPLNLLQLYEAFVKKKRKMYFKEHIEEEKQYPQFMKNHMHAAVWTFFSKQEFADLNISDRSAIESELKTFYDQIKSSSEKIGIIDGINPANQLPRFTHRTFCEYFVATWISQNYENNGDFLMKKTFDSSFKFINALLNQILTKEKQLHIFVLQRDLKGVQNFLQSDSESVDVTDEGGRTALHLVALIWDRNYQSDYVEIARLLLEHGASVNATDKVLHLKPLEVADKTDAWTIAGLILQHGGDVADLKVTENNMDEEVFEAFVKFLNQPGSDVADLITTATKHDEKQLVRYLVEEYKADVNCSGEDGVTLMHWAAYGGHINLMIYLNEHGASFLSLDKENRLPLHYAAKHGGKNAVEFLVEHKSEIEALNKSSETPFLIAAGSVDANLKVMKYLKKKGANINACNEEGLSSLYLAAESGKLCKVKYLCTVMSKTAVAKFGQGALQCSIQKEHRHIIKFLKDDANISLPITSLSLFAEAISFVLAIFSLGCAIFFFKGMLESVPDGINPWLLENFQNNGAKISEISLQRHIVNMTSFLMEGHPFLPTADKEQLNVGSKLKNDEELTNIDRWLPTRWLADYTDSQYLIWKVTPHIFALICVIIHRGWTAKQVGIGLLSWSLGLILSEYSLEGALILAGGELVWILSFFVGKGSTHEFVGAKVKFLVLTLSCVTLWTLSLICTAIFIPGFIFVLAGGVNVIIGIIWQQEIEKIEEKCYKIFLAIHSTGILCAIWFTWILGNVEPTWFAWSTRLMLAGYVASVISFSHVERFLPTAASPNEPLKTKIRLRFAWLLLLIPMWAFVTASNAVWESKMSWARWIVMTIVPLHVFTMFFEWGRKQLKK